MRVENGGEKEPEFRDGEFFPPRPGPVAFAHVRVLVQFPSSLIVARVFFSTVTSLSMEAAMFVFILGSSFFLVIIAIPFLSPGCCDASLSFGSATIRSSHFSQSI